ncbi:MAG TPA: hypothetical protein VJT50_10675 [Pyrinomonadaceae bacterium]|nr:hypothetical protein [Pyrinomonadaceae bacterium]
MAARHAELVPRRRFSSRKPLVDASGIGSDELLVMICAPAEMRSSFRLGVWARNAREQHEDGADDHTPRNDIKLASLCESGAGTVSPRRSRIRPSE